MARARNFSSPLLTLAAIVLVIAALHLGKEVLVPFALSVFISFLLTPAANRLERWGLGRIPSVLAVVSVSFAILGLLGWVVTSQMVDLGSQLSTYKTTLIKKIHDIQPESSTLSDLSQTFEDVQKSFAKGKPEAGATDQGASKKNAAPPPGGVVTSTVKPKDQQTSSDASKNRLKAASMWDRMVQGFSWDAVDEAQRRPVDVRVVESATSPFAQVRDWLGPLVAPLATASVAIILVIFMLLKREDQRNRLLQLFGASHLHATTEALNDVTDRVIRYLRMQFLINACYGVVVTLGMALIGVPNAIMWGVMSFALRFLPYIGPCMSAVMPLFVSIATSEGWRQPLEVIAWFVVLELLVNNVAEPMLYGRSTGVSGVGVIVAAIFWTWIWGGVGLLLAMPLTVCAVVMAQYIPSLRFLAILFGDEPPMPIEQQIYQRLLADDDEEARELIDLRLRETSLLEMYDVAVIPALRLAERDRHAGLLHDEQEATVIESARELIENLGEAAVKAAPVAAATESGEIQPRRVRVLCIPLRDQADEIGAAMLKQLLEQQGFEVEVAVAQALTGELVDSIEALKIDVAVISILPPLPPRNSRLLSRRLRDRYPDLPIIVGYWCGACTPDFEGRLTVDGGVTVTTLAAAIDRVQAISTRPQLIEKVG